MSTTASEPQPRTAENTNVADLLTTVAPPREGTTGVHLVSVGERYVLTIQGPEARWLTARVIEFVEALHEKSAEVVARQREDKERGKARRMRAH